MTQIVGRRLGRYEVQQEIGRGGMARVYRALDTLLQRSVAIKVMAPQLGLDPEFADRFEREAIMAANLHHPAIVTVYDVGDQDGLRYLAMEFIRGRTLHAILTERGALGLGYAVSLLEPVARALDYAHSQGAVHRDVKPHNIMVDVDGRVLLTDFGIAQAPETEHSERLTRTGVFMGTPEYISPEQAQARRVDGRSDLYSLGIVAYETITGRVPFSGATPNLLVAHTQTPPPPATSIVDHLPQEVDTVLARALAKSPQARFATGIAMVEALRIVARRNGISLATSKQIAALAVPLAVAKPPSSATGVPVAPDSPQRPPPPRPVALPPLGEDTLVATPGRQPVRPQPSRAQPASVPAPSTAPVTNSGTRRLLAVAAPLLAVLLLGLILVVFSGRVIGIGDKQPTPPTTPSVVLPTAVGQPAGGATGPVPTLIATSEPSTTPTLQPSPSTPADSPTVVLAATSTVAAVDTDVPTLASTATLTPTLRRVPTNTRPRPSRTATAVPEPSTPTPQPPTPDPPTPTPELPTPEPPPPETPTTTAAPTATRRPAETELPTVKVGDG